MAVKTFEEVISSLSADEKKLLDNTLTKYPELKEGWLRQDDYSRKMNELKAKESEYEEGKAYTEKMKDWADRNVPRWEALEEKGYIDKETGEELFTAQKAELERQLDEARKQIVAGGADMDAAELDRRVTEIVKASGGATKEELTALIQSEAKKMAEEAVNTRLSAKETEFNEKTIPFVAGFSSGVAVVAAKYERETGKPWTAETSSELFALMTKEKNFDPYAVGEMMLEPARKEKAAQEEIDRKANERADEIIKSRGGMPGSGNEPYIPQSSEKGNLQKMLERSQGEGDFESMIAARAVEAAKELRAEGKS